MLNNVSLRQNGIMMFKPSEACKLQRTTYGTFEYYCVFGRLSGLRFRKTTLYFYIYIEHSQGTVYAHMLPKIHTGTASNIHNGSGLAMDVGGP